MAQTLVTIPNTKAYHVPLPGSKPILLAEGDLVLSIIPSHPPDHPTQTITLSVGHATFPITPKTPAVKTDTTEQHAAFTFKPLLAEHAAGERVGKVKVTLKPSTGPAEYERTEAQAMVLEKSLRDLGCFHQPDYYELEDEADAAAGEAAGYGTTIADTLTSYGKWIASRVEAFTNSRIEGTPATTTPANVPQGVKGAAESVKTGSATVASYTHGATETIGEVVHDGAKYLGALAGGAYKSIHDAVVPPPSTGSAAAAEAGNARSEFAKGAGEVVKNVTDAAGETWEEVKLGAGGAATGAKEVTDSVAENTYKSVEHGYGQEANAVARDMGATGTNTASVALDATLVTSVMKHGYDAGTGAVEGYQSGTKGV
ncbi:hypothetical protein QFC20_002761 [Naganishia adeliensis]|uniref:Uncharacterized protein n=1 Tax=Naganishia adeliensis TaxID=92952 RepID=A0ACC2WHA4_9TREE|nr:hypothetical protein QFC20_002761 [Naganishia adeliensis]